MPIRKWTWNYNFFVEQTPNTAYWSGFIMADGNIRQVSKNSYTLALGTSEIDRDHLVSFCTAIGLSHDAIYKSKGNFGGKINGRQVGIGKDFYFVHINAVNLLNDLISWGVIPHKTYQFVEPSVELSLLPHYLRGWADGDGHIYRYGRGARFTISGNVLALQWYANSLRCLGFGGHLHFITRNDNYTVLYIGGVNQVDEICSLLLVDDGYTRLDRKWTSKYDSTHKLIDVECVVCGNHFGVPKFRYNHPTQGRFCSKACYDAYQRKPIIDGKFQCARCKQWKDIEHQAANKSYCKPCWNEKSKEYKQKHKSS